MIEITSELRLDDDEIELAYIRAHGPGGQNINKVSTAVQLRFNIKESPSLPQEVKQRLMRLAGKRMTAQGILIIEARQFRSLERNRQAALLRLVRLIQRASVPPTPRLKTKPTPASKEQRLISKHKRGEIKRLRRQPRVEE